MYDAKTRNFSKNDKVLALDVFLRSVLLKKLELEIRQLEKRWGDL
jgi:hypothetical protein